MAAITAKANGNWNATGTWTGGVVPGAGDTVSTSSFTVTVTDNRACGAANGIYVSGTNPAALAIGTGAIVINAGVTLTLYGDLICNGSAGTGGFAGVTMGAGSRLIINAGTSTAGTQYGWRNITGSGCRQFSLVCNGTQANPCYVMADSSGANMYVTSPGSQVGTLTATWTYFIRMGDASHSAWYIAFDSLRTLNLTNCTFDSCGFFSVGVAPTTTGLCNLTNVVFKNSLGVANIGTFTYGSFTNCVFDAPGALSNNFTTNATWNTTYWHLGAVGSNGKWTAMNNTFIRFVTLNIWNAYSDMAGLVMIYDANVDNPQFIMLPSISQTFTDAIFECTHSSGQGDTNHLTNTPSAGTVYTLRRHLILPNAAGNCSCTAMTLQFVSANGKVDIQHFTVCAGVQGFHYGETTESLAGTVTSLRNNIVWNTNTYAFYYTGAIIQDLGHLSSANPSPEGGTITDVVSPANADYNCSYQIAKTYTASGNSWFTNQGRGYQGAFSSTPGAHDKVDVNPQFVDPTRNTATFDTAYLGHVAGSTWASHASSDQFNPGDIVSNNNAIFYSGAVVNFRCIAQHLKSDGHEPGGSFTSDWRNYWELASYGYIRDSVAQGAANPPTAYSDASLGLTNVDLIQVLRAWITAGFAPQNTSLRAAGHDGTDIGAVPCVGANQHNFMSMGC